MEYSLSAFKRKKILQFATTGTAEHQGHYAEWKKPVTRGQALCEATHMSPPKRSPRRQAAAR